MAQIKVISIDSKRDVTAKNGQPISVYSFVAQDESGNMFTGSTYSKEIENKINQWWDGEIQETPYGKLFRPTRQDLRQAFAGRGTPEERASIERQVSLKAAVDLAEAKIESGEKLGSIDVIKVADLFVDWLSNKQSPAVAEKPTVKKSTVTKQSKSRKAIAR